MSCFNQFFQVKISNAILLFKYGQAKYDRFSLFYFENYQNFKFNAQFIPSPHHAACSDMHWIITWSNALDSIDYLNKFYLSVFCTLKISWNQEVLTAVGKLPSSDEVTLENGRSST